jgi:hypothetical protein
VGAWLSSTPAPHLLGPLTLRPLHCRLLLSLRVQVKYSKTILLLLPIRLASQTAAGVQ